MIEANTCHSVATFRLPRWCRLLGAVPLVLLPISAVVLLALLDEYISAVLFLCVAVFLASHRSVDQIQVSSQGVRVYRFWWIPWQSVSAVKLERVFGLPYFRVKRHRALPVWIPLYYVGTGDLKQTIATAAPVGHPFERAAKRHGWHAV